nr:40S ribosomal protein S30-B [Kwoniella shandongensis]KAA5524989.1 40S ribosomal protein S30-B [Kwoniella shandongensis]
MGKVHGSLARAGKVKSQCPKVEKQEKKKTPKGRAKKRLQYNRRYVEMVEAIDGVILIIRRFSLLPITQIRQRHSRPRWQAKDEPATRRKVRINGSNELELDLEISVDGGLRECIRIHHGDGNFLGITWTFRN